MGGGCCSGTRERGPALPGPRGDVSRGAAGRERGGSTEAAPQSPFLPEEARGGRVVERRDWGRGSRDDARPRPLHSFLVSRNSPDNPASSICLSYLRIIPPPAPWTHFRRSWNPQSPLTHAISPGRPTEPRSLPDAPKRFHLPEIPPIFLLAPCSNPRNLPRLPEPSYILSPPQTPAS